MFLYKFFLHWHINFLVGYSMISLSTLALTLRKKIINGLFCFYCARLDPARQRPTAFVRFGGVLFLFFWNVVNSSVITISIQFCFIPDQQALKRSCLGLFVVVDRTLKCSPLHFQMDLKSQLRLRELEIPKPLLFLWFSQLTSLLINFNL